MCIIDILALYIYSHKVPLSIYRQESDKFLNLEKKNDKSNLRMIDKSALGPWVAHLRMKGKHIIPPSVYARKSVSDVGENKSMQNVTAKWG